MTQPAYRPRLIILILLTAVSTLSLNMFTPSLANIAADFEASWAMVNIAIAGYLAVVALLQLFVGPLSDRYGRRPVLLVSLVVFVVASFGCLMATTIESFLVFRMFQTTVYAGWVLSMAMVRDTSDQREAATLISLISMAMAIAPMMGPLIGGSLDLFFGWRANFALYLGLGAFLLLVCMIDLKETNHSRSSSISQQWRSYPELLGAGRYWGYVMCQSFSVGAFYIFIGGAPLVATAVFGFSAAKLGLIIGSITAGFAFGAFLSSRLTKGYPLINLIISGRVLASAGLGCGLIHVLSGVVTPWTVFGATLFVGIGNGLTVPSCSSGYMSVIPRLAGSAAGLAGTMAVATGALLTWISGTMLTAENGAYMLLGFMLASSFSELVAILIVRQLERRKPNQT